MVSWATRGVALLSSRGQLLSLLLARLPHFVGLLPHIIERARLVGLIARLEQLLRIDLARGKARGADELHDPWVDAELRQEVGVAHRMMHSFIRIRGAGGCGGLGQRCFVFLDGDQRPCHAVRRDGRRGLNRDVLRAVEHALVVVQGAVVQHADRVVLGRRVLQVVDRQQHRVRVDTAAPHVARCLTIQAAGDRDDLPRSPARLVQVCDGTRVTTIRQHQDAHLLVCSLDDGVRKLIVSHARVSGDLPIFVDEAVRLVLAVGLVAIVVPHAGAMAGVVDHQVVVRSAPPADVRDRLMSDVLLTLVVVHGDAVCDAARPNQRLHVAPIH
mmetsp:Transcript_55653/g.161269  ORF Transcript_55653/g.161269 Transcript_55653/m.161269 type:complete len:328 (+) Transcript_55653:144-1127(+)